MFEQEGHEAYETDVIKPSWKEYSRLQPSKQLFHTTILSIEISCHVDTSAAGINIFPELSWAGILFFNWLQKTNVR